MTLNEYLNKHGLTQSEFAVALGVTQGAVWHWLSGRKPVSAESCIAIERLTAGEVRCEDLRPDIDWSVIRGKRARRPVAA